MTATPLPIAGGSPPRLLLDTNVFRDLAEGKLAPYEQRLLEVAKHRSPPLLWACPIVFEEVACHIRAEEAARFEHFRDTLRWMEKLCNNLGMAEDLPWVLRRGVFEREVPYDGALSTAINRIRREVISLERFTDVPPGLLEAINKTRVQARERLDAWAARREAIKEAARSKPKPGERGVDGAVAASNAIFVVSRKHTAADAPLWGPFRLEKEQRHEQREQAAFELAHLVNSRNPQGYNPRSHEGDYNDGWLLAYLAVGYRLVTSDRRLRRALEIGECEDPRVSDVAEALEIAETWLVRSGE